MESEFKVKTRRQSSHGRRLDICSIRNFGAVHVDTLETPICVDAHLVLCAVVLSGGTLVDVCERKDRHSETSEIQTEM